MTETRLSDRARVARHDAGDPELTRTYDLVTAFFCLHDRANPVAALQAVRRLAAEVGTVLVADGRVAEEFLGQDTNRDVERQFYGFSVLHCLPVAMIEAPAAGTGTVMRPEVLRRYAREAGFREVEILPVNDTWSSFYRLRA